MDNVNSVAFDINYIAGYKDRIINSLNIKKFNEKELISLLSKKGRELYNKIKPKSKMTTKSKPTMVHISNEMYTTILKATRKNSSRKTGKVNQTTATMAEIVGCSSGSVKNAWNKAIREGVLRKEGSCKGSTYIFN